MKKLSLLLCLAVMSFAPRLAAQDRVVTVNGSRLSAPTMQALEQHYRVRVASGAYWYDPWSGAWGVMGGPTAGLIVAGLDFGGQLHPDASGGSTLVWVNGRRLPWQDLVALQQITGPIQPGRYWLDGNGNAGIEGGPAIVNLRQLAAQSGGSAWSHHTRTTDASVGGDGEFFYYIDRDVSVTGGQE
jgi:hypothetical protein